MSRGQRVTERAERIQVLLEAGDHRRARAEAQAVLADASASERERAAAAGVIESIVPDRGVLAAGAVGVAAAVAIAARVLLHG